MAVLLQSLAALALFAAARAGKGTGGDFGDSAALRGFAFNNGEGDLGGNSGGSVDFMDAYIKHASGSSSVWWKDSGASAGSSQRAVGAEEEMQPRRMPWRRPAATAEWAPRPQRHEPAAAEADWAPRPQRHDPFGRAGGMQFRRSWDLPARAPANVDAPAAMDAPADMAAAPAAPKAAFSTGLNDQGNQGGAGAAVVDVTLDSELQVKNKAFWNDWGAQMLQMHA